MRGTIAALTVAAVMFGSGPARSQPPRPDDMVWHWFGTCREGKTMLVEVLFDGKRVFTSSFPLCLMRRARTESEPKHDNLPFFFKAPARIFGAEFASLGTTQIDGNLWEAGNEQDRVLLGVSFTAKDHIFLDTVYPASARAASQAELADRLIIRTAVQPLVRK